MPKEVLAEYAFELVVDTDDPVPLEPGLTLSERDGGAKVLAKGGLDGALAAVNSVLGPQGYVLQVKVHE